VQDGALLDSLNVIEPESAIRFTFTFQMVLCFNYCIVQFSVSLVSNFLGLFTTLKNQAHL